mmetsp:Transcript_122094/g.304711  ORF Transcript_122094/g.304711 Transcript_122094/m.304711 type:complete len:224 (-) Transcript_122094:1108-1779(-)
MGGRGRAIQIHEERCNQGPQIFEGRFFRSALEFFCAVPCVCLNQSNCRAHEWQMPDPKTIQTTGHLSNQVLHESNAGANLGIDVATFRNDAVHTTDRNAPTAPNRLCHSLVRGLDALDHDVGVRLQGHAVVAVESERSGGGGEEVMPPEAPACEIRMQDVGDLPHAEDQPRALEDDDEPHRPRLEPARRCRCPFTLASRQHLLEDPTRLADEFAKISGLVLRL